MRRATLRAVVLGVVLTTTTASTAAQSTPPVVSSRTRVWIDAFGFARGETLPLKDAVEVRDTD